MSMHRSVSIHTMFLLEDLCLLYTLCVHLSICRGHEELLSAHIFSVHIAQSVKIQMLPTAFQNAGNDRCADRSSVSAILNCYDKRQGQLLI